MEWLTCRHSIESVVNSKGEKETIHGVRTFDYEYVEC